MRNPTPTLEQKIVAALTAADVTSTDLSQLIAETDVGITTADATAEQERERALDPVKSPDPKQARQAMEEAIFARDRLRTLLPRLQQQHKDVQEKEYVERWREDFERVEAKRDALAAEYAETYPQVVERLVDLLHRVEACDREVSHINRMSPSGGAHLCEVELTARGIEQLLQPDVVIAKELRLPTFKRGANQPLLAWPPPQPSLAAQMASMRVPGGPGPDWHAATEERDRRRREESQRLSAYYEERERELDVR